MADTLEQALGLPLELVDALERAFPHVKAPTLSQTALMKALLPVQARNSGKGKAPQKINNGVILRDVTGSGK
jgi:hypothetical protein